MAMAMLAERYRALIFFVDSVPRRKINDRRSNLEMA